ncbi:Integrase, catalytic core [Sesbania bispinosa]|nr:Integrase, catalytic core [Sesbania bispinosa]
MSSVSLNTGFVDGTILMPVVDSPYLAHWMRGNAMVKGWLKSAMDKEVRSSVRYATTAREIKKVIFGIGGLDMHKRPR